MLFNCIAPRKFTVFSKSSRSLQNLTEEEEEVKEYEEQAPQYGKMVNPMYEGEMDVDHYVYEEQ